MRSAFSVITLLAIALASMPSFAREHNSFYELFLLAKKSNESFDTARFQTLAAREGYKGAKAQYLPTLTLNSSATYTDKTDTMAGASSSDQAWNFNFAQFSASISIFNKALDQLKMLKKYQLRSTEISEKLVSQSFMLNFVDLYGNLILLETNRQIQMGIVKFYHDLLMKDTVSMDPNDPIRIQIELTYHQTNLGLQAFLSQYDQLKNQFLNVLDISEINGLYGFIEDYDFDAAFPAPARTKAERDLEIEQMVNKASGDEIGSGNLQFKLASLQYEQAKDLEKFSRRSNLNIYGQANYGWGQYDSKSLGVAVDSESYSLTLGLSMPIFDRTITHQRRESKYQKISAQSRFRQSKKDLRLQAKNILSELDSAHAILGSIQTKIQGRNLETLIDEQQERFQATMNSDTRDIPTMLAQLGSMQLTFVMSQQTSQAVKNIIVGNLKRKLFTGSISENDIKELSEKLNDFRLFPEHIENDTDQPIIEEFNRR